MNQAYPNIDELMPPLLQTRIPMQLGEEIKRRYNELGDKYQTMNQHTDGRFMNGMMFTSRIDNALEEIVDAVFCMLGHVFRCTARGEEPSENIYTALTGLIDIWSLLTVEKTNDPFAP